MNDKLGFKGWYEVRAFDIHGNDKTHLISSPKGHLETINGSPSYVFDNTLTNAGFAEIAGLLCADVGGTGWDYTALGTGDTAPAAAQTALVAEIATSGGERSAGTGTRQTTTVANDTFQLVTTFNFTGALAIKEVGIFNATPAGTMLSRQLLTYTAADGDSIVVTFKCKVASA
jgi:hypothetical protein